MCSLYSLKVANIVKLEAILFMLIDGQNVKIQLGNRANRIQHTLINYYAKKSGSPFLLRNASRMQHFQK